MSDLSKLERRVKNVLLPYPLMVGGGVFKTVEELVAVADTDVIPEWGSIETVQSDGNGGDDYSAVYGPNGDLIYTRNRRGIPNPGMAYVEQHAGDLIKRYADRGKPLTLNVSGKGSEDKNAVNDLLTLMKRGIDCGFPIITANGACPNKAGQPILCWDIEGTTELFQRMEEEIGSVDPAILWKVSVGMDQSLLSFNLGCVAGSNVVSGIITGNTVINTFDCDSEGKPTILTTKDKATRGGMGGPAILPMALGDTQFCVDNMPKDKVVVGGGGAVSVETVMKFIHTGATIVQTTSGYIEADKTFDPHSRHKGPDYFTGLLAGIEARA
ncbi:hypothetical protein H7X87_03485 [Acetobacteraceae bacterium]|nr:hypothetical protein [Candidatus Parcubacteria bacterium]